MRTTNDPAHHVPRRRLSMALRPYGPHERRPRPARSRAMNEQPHILALDDDPSIRELVADYLAENDLRVTAVASGARADAVMAREIDRPGRARPAAARRGRHADRAPPARGLGHPDPDADRPHRRGRPRDGPRARRRRLPDQAVQPARAAGAHPRAAAPREGAGHGGRRDRQGARLPLRRLGAEHRPAPAEVRRRAQRSS